MNSCAFCNRDSYGAITLEHYSNSKYTKINNDTLVSGAKMIFCKFHYDIHRKLIQRLQERLIKKMVIKK